MDVEVVQVSECCDSAVDQDDDMVGQPTELFGVVGDPHDGHSRVGDRTSELLDGTSRSSIERSGRLIGQENVGLGQQSPGDRHPLCLTATQVGGRSLEQFRPEPDPFERGRRRRIVQPGAGHLQVVPHRAREDRRPLEDHRDASAELGRVPVPQVSIPPPDMTRHRIVEAIQQPKEGRFARTGRTGDREHAGDRNGEIDRPQDGCVDRPGSDVAEFEDRPRRHDRTVPARAAPTAGRLPAMSRRLVPTIATVAAAVVTFLGGAFVQAHSGLAAASPGPGVVVGGTVDRIQIFYGDIILAFDGTVTLQETGEQIPGRAEMVSDIEGVIVLDEPLSVDGEYAVRHTITSFDGDVVEAAYLFSYDADAAPPRIIFVEEEDGGGVPWFGWVLIGLGGVMIVVLAVRLVLAIRRRARMAAPASSD